MRTAAAIEAFGPDVTELGSWGSSYQAGVGQAPSVAGRIRASCAAL
jgi:hypothetical protein